MTFSMRTAGLARRASRYASVDVRVTEYGLRHCFGFLSARTRPSRCRRCSTSANALGAGLVSALIQRLQSHRSLVRAPFRLLLAFGLSLDDVCGAMVSFVCGMVPTEKGYLRE